jgi:hypothetical protein
MILILNELFNILIHHKLYENWKNVGLSQIVADKTAALANNNPDQSQEETQTQQQEQESTPNTTQDTQMIVDEESTSQPSLA